MPPSFSMSNVPWYRQLWPWFLIFFPLTAVIAGGVTLWLAVKTSDGLVVDDYYKQGLAIKQTMERSDKARGLGLDAHLVLKGREVAIELNALDVSNPPPSIRLTLSHPTRGGMDQELLMVRTARGYLGELAPFSNGRWNIQIEDELRTWRLNGAINFPMENEVRINASDIQPIER